MHFRDSIERMVVAVDLEYLTGDWRFNDVVLESVAQHEHVDYVEEHKEKADVLSPGLFEWLKERQIDTETLLEGNAHVQWNMSNTTIWVSFRSSWNVLIVNIKGECHILTVYLLEIFQELLLREIMGYMVFIIVDLALNWPILEWSPLVEI